MGTPITFDQLMTRIADKPLDFKPGTQWEYSSTNYLLLGRVVEVVSGETWDGYVRKHIFERADMTDSSTIAQERVLADMARGYAFANGQNAPSVPLDESWAGAAGGIVTTVGDLAKWHESLEDGKIISMDDYLLLTKPAQLPAGSSSEYGFGLYVDTYDGQPRIWHDGNTFGFDASDQLFPKQDTRIIVLTNSADGNSTELVARIYNELFPAIASAARNGSAGADPAIAEKLDAHAQTVSISMAPLDIFRRTLAVMHSVSAPAFLQYKVQANTSHRGTVVIQHFVHVERTADRKDKARSTDARLHREIHPLNVAPDLFLGRATTPAASSPNEFVLGLDGEDAGPLTTIAKVASRSHYTVTLAGIEHLSGCGTTVHLRLDPLRDPMVFNLRDLWIDSATSRICKANAVWWAVLYPERVVATVNLDLDADGLIKRYTLSISTRLLLVTDSARQDASFNDIRSVGESVWAAAPVLDWTLQQPHS